LVETAKKVKYWGGTEMREIERNEERQIESSGVETERDILSSDASPGPSPVLARLIEEVRNEEPSMLLGYNRFHNRHNR
jgi:hypothetical protein